jgi:hypothetical protein
MLIKIASGRVVTSGVHSTAGNSSGKRTSSSSTLQSSSSETSLASAVKLGQAGRDKERKEKEDVELKPPWDLSPYSRDVSAGKPHTFILFQLILILSLGYPDFYPSKGTEEEYKLTDKVITDGFENKPVVNVASYSRLF